MKLRRRAVPQGLLVRGGLGANDIFVPHETRSALQYVLARAELEQDHLPTSFAITAAMRGDGVSFIASSLAAVLAVDHARPTCLIEADWLHHGVPGANGLGLGDLITGRCTIEDAIIDMDTYDLSVITPGNFPRDRMIPLTSEVLTTVIDVLSTEFEHIVIGLPALDDASATMSLAAIASASLLVVRQGSTSLEQAERAMADLDRDNFLGCVLNGSKFKTPTPIRRRLLEE